MRRLMLFAALLTLPLFGLAGKVSAQQPLVLTASPIEVVGSVSQVRANGRVFNVNGETFRLLPDALVTDAGGGELSIGEIRPGARIGLVQDGGEVSHVIVYEGQDR